MSDERRLRSPMIQCAKGISLPDGLRDSEGNVAISCSEKSTLAGEPDPGDTSIGIHLLKHDHRGHHNRCLSNCPHNTFFYPKRRTSIFDYLPKSEE